MEGVPGGPRDPGSAMGHGGSRGHGGPRGARGPAGSGVPGLGLTFPFGKCGPLVSKLLPVKIKITNHTIDLKICIFIVFRTLKITKF